MWIVSFKEVDHTSTAGFKTSTKNLAHNRYREQKQHDVKLFHIKIQHQVAPVKQRHSEIRTVRQIITSIAKIYCSNLNGCLR
jgi:hypothetical protein